MDSAGESGEKAESDAQGEERHELESEGTKGGGESQDEVQPLPDSSGDSGGEAPYGEFEENTIRRLPLDLDDPYY